MPSLYSQGGEDAVKIEMKIVTIFYDHLFDLKDQNVKYSSLGCAHQCK